MLESGLRMAVVVKLDESNLVAAEARELLLKIELYRDRLSSAVAAATIPQLQEALAEAEALGIALEPEVEARGLLNQLISKDRKFDPDSIPNSARLTHRSGA